VELPISDSEPTLSAESVIHKMPLWLAVGGGERDEADATVQIKLDLRQSTEQLQAFDACATKSSEARLPEFLFTPTSSQNVGAVLNSPAPLHAK